MARKCFAVLGAGRQGIAAAYDLVRFGDPDRVLLTDKDYAAAKAGAERVNGLTGKRAVLPFQLEVSQADRVAAALVGTHAMISAMHYKLNPLLTQVAIRIGAHLCDLGGNTRIVWRQHRLYSQARRAGVSIVPDCGMGPGMNLSLARYAMRNLRSPRDVRIYCGGLPQHPKPPLFYELLFSMDGLVNEYSGKADLLSGGHLAKKSALSDVEAVKTALGVLEAASTSGGLSTAPWTFRKLFPDMEGLEYKTLRYGGHWNLVREAAQSGRLAKYLSTTLTVRNAPVEDVGIIQVIASGINKTGKAVQSTIELIDYYDAETKFTAMQRLTGFHASIIAILAVRDMIPAGVNPVESIDGELVVKEARKRGFRITEKIRNVRN